MDKFDPNAPEHAGETWWRVNLRDKETGKKLHFTVMAKTNEDATHYLSVLAVGENGNWKPFFQVYDWRGTEPDYAMREEAGRQAR